MSKRNVLKIIFTWLLAIIWGGLIFYLSSVSDFSVATGTAKRSNFLSGIIHVLLYIILSFLLIRALLTSGLSRGRAFLFGFLVASLYGISDEWHQSFVPSREARVTDWLLDVAGAYLTLSCYTYKYKYRRRQ
ncbi:MAG: VanZ family protein [Patescibacteria group bacterium]